MNIWALIAIMEEKNISTYNLSKLSKMIVNSNDKKASYYSTLIYCIKNYSLTWIIRLFSRITCLWKKFYNFTLNSII